MEELVPQNHSSPRFLSSPEAASRSRHARGLDKNLGREGIITEWA
ncbi:MAG: hypothetical protein FD163_1680 [Hyphomonadaceae bacterium]|nr:MAG: hypothetical protein FD163_1680 [Hyphomonadaceae bacterium]